MVKCDVGIELEKRQAASRSRGYPELNLRKTTDKVVRSVPGRSIEKPEILGTSITDGGAGVCGLIAIYRNIATVAAAELVPDKVS